MTAVGDGPGASGRGPLTGVSWLDWKLGARLLLKYPALTIIGGLSLAGGLGIWAGGLGVAGEMLFKRLAFGDGGRGVGLVAPDKGAAPGGAPGRAGFCDWRGGA